MASSPDLPPIGTTICKYFEPHEDFEGGYFYGQVAFYSFGGKYVRVVYEDGDREDMYPSDINELAYLPANKLKIPPELLQPTKEDLLNGAIMPPSPRAAATRKAADNDDEDDGQRRSKRVKKSTVVYVGKDAVKRDNNYVLKGLTYEYGAFDETAPSKPAPPRRVTKAPAQPKKPRVMSPEEKARREMKLRIEQNKADKASLRRAFLHKHAAVLQPFCPDLKETAPAATAVPEIQVEVMQPDSIQAQLRDYQLEGLNFMSSMYQQNMSMILGDEMGLGKTLQTISLVCLLKEKWNQSGPSLIICPLSVLYSWCQEIDKWAPSLKYLRFHCSNTEQMDKENLMEYDIIVTTYEMSSASNLQSLWSRQHFNLVVLDEGHRIKCSTTLISQAVRRLHAECRIILTGTPLANNLTELWALLNFLEPEVFSTSQPFDDAFDLTHNKVDNVKLDQAHELLQVVMLRRLKATVEQSLPPKIETRVLCPLSNSQIWWYKALLVKDLSIVVDGPQTQAKKGALSNLLMQLRKCCLHPFLFPGAEDDPDTTSLEDLIGQSGKVAVLDLLLQSLYKKGHRVTLFSQFTSVLDILDDYCRMRGWKFCRFDGGTARAFRNHQINAFNAPNSDKFIFLMSTRSGGMGINLQTADTCILFDSDWNPQPDIQAIGRTHRLGQTKTVHIYRLCTVGTVEQRMQERAEKKLYLDRMVTRDNARPTFGVEDDDNTGNLLSTLRFGCNAVFGSGGKVHELPTNEDIELITDRTRTEDFTSGKLQGNAEQSVDTFDEKKTMVSTMEFGGIDFQQLREQHLKNGINKLGDIQQMWAKRQRKNRIKMLDGKGSGYGSACVPVLAANNYNLLEGEKSVFDRELVGKHQKTVKKKAGKGFENQDFCQVCGDGGTLFCCPRCPMSVHLQCVGVKRAKDLLCCTHHHCSLCSKTASAAGGLLYPCMACPNTYCEDDLPHSARLLDDGCERMEKLGYHIKNGVYVICSEQCEKVAKLEMGWKEPTRSKAPCPKPIDVSTYFGGEVDDNLQNDANDSLVVEGKRKRKKVNYSISRDKPVAANGFVAEAPRPAGAPSRLNNRVGLNPSGSRHPVATLQTTIKFLPKKPPDAAPYTTVYKAPPVRSDSAKENSGATADTAIDLTD